MDWLLTNGDLSTDSGDIAWATSVEAIAQHCTIRFRTFLAEYWLNLNIGIDYYGKILVKNPNLVTVQSIFRRTILGTPGVVALLSFEMALDKTTRTASVTFRASTTDGPLDYSEEFVL